MCLLGVSALIVTTIYLFMEKLEKQKHMSNIRTTNKIQPSGHLIFIQHHDVATTLMQRCMTLYHVPAGNVAKFKRISPQRNVLFRRSCFRAGYLEVEFDLDKISKINMIVLKFHIFPHENGLFLIWQGIAPTASSSYLCLNSGLNSQSRDTKLRIL